MECSKKAIEYAWDEICQKIYDGIELYEIHEIATIIKDLDCIEKFIETMGVELTKSELFSWFIKNIKEELFDTEKYIDKFKETQNLQFKVIAKQEWEHAGSLIKMIDNTKITEEERVKLQELINKHNTLSTKLI